MNDLDRFHSTVFKPLIHNSKREDLLPLDLSVDSIDFDLPVLQDPELMWNKINNLLIQHHRKVAFGGYLERRKLYERSKHFTQSKRSIHLGTDFWCKEGSQVCSPEEGIVHSKRINTNFGDYGPTLILQHEDSFGIYYTLYGHLNTKDYNQVNVGDQIKKGEVFASLGGWQENGNYAPHLHFQLIIDLQNNSGDYPGVCSNEEVDFYRQNCPNPIPYLGI